MGEKRVQCSCKSSIKSDDDNNSTLNCVFYIMLMRAASWIFNSKSFQILVFENPVLRFCNGFKSSVQLCHLYTHNSYAHSYKYADTVRILFVSSHKHTQTHTNECMPQKTRRRPFIFQRLRIFLPVFIRTNQ